MPGGLVLLAILGGTTVVGSCSNTAVQASRAAKLWYYTGTLSADIATSRSDTAGRCTTAAHATEYANDKSSNTVAKNQPAVTIIFFEKCTGLPQDGATTITYWFTASRTHLNDGSTALPPESKNGVLIGTALRIQPASPPLSPTIIAKGKATIDNAYFPAIVTKQVTVSTAASGQVTRTASTALKLISLPIHMAGVYKTNKLGVITQFVGNKTFKPYFFEGQKGSIRVTWSLGYRPA